MLLLLSALSLAHAQDADSDTVTDSRDRCSFEDDRVDLDGNSVPDCAETMFGEFGFADYTSTVTSGWYHNVYPRWSSADLNGYAYSGVAEFGPATVVPLTYLPCVQISVGTEYRVMAQAGTSGTQSEHDLIIEEYTDTSCGRRTATRVLDTEYRAPGQTHVTLVGTWQAQTLGVRAVKVSTNFDTLGPGATGWWDNFSMHAR